MKINFKYKLFIFSIIFISISFLINILKIGIISDYEYVYNLDSFLIEKGLTVYDFFWNLINIYNSNRISPGGSIIQLIVSQFNFLFFFKIFHFLVLIIFFFIFFLFIKKFFSKFFAFLSILLCLIFFQFTEYLDPFIAWPEGVFFVTFFLISTIMISYKICLLKKVNLIIFFFLILLNLFYAEVTVFFIPIILLSLIYNLSFETIKKKKIYFFILFFILGLYFFIFINFYFYSNIDIYPGALISISLKESFGTFFFHLLRTIPLTWLFVTDKFSFFIKYFLSNISFFYFLIFFLYLFCISSVLKNLNKSKNLINHQFFYIIGIYLILFPSLLMSISKRYSFQIFDHGFGHAHYIVVHQYIGAILLIICLLSRFNKFLKNNLLRNFISIFLSFIFLINYSLANYTASRLEPHRNVYPYLIFENFLRNDVTKDIQTVIILEKENYGFWTHKQFFQTNLSRKIKNTFTDFWLAEKDKRLKDVTIDEGDSYLIIKKLDFSNPNKLILDGCIDKLENKFDKWQDCKGNFIYEEERRLIYYIKSRRLEFLKS